MQTLTITNGDLLSALIARMDRHILQIISYMISSAGVCIPIMFCGVVERSSHCCKLHKRMPALEGVIHLVIAVKSQMSSAIANLATRFRICILIIGWVLCVAIVLASSIVSASLTMAATTIYKVITRTRSSIAKRRSGRSFLVTIFRCEQGSGTEV